MTIGSVFRSGRGILTRILHEPKQHLHSHASFLFGVDNSSDYALQNDTSLYNKILHDLSQKKHYESVVATYREMLQKGIVGDAFSFPPLLKACEVLVDEVAASQLHARGLVAGFVNDYDVHAETALLSLYAEWGRRHSARIVLRDMVIKQMFHSRLTFRVTLKASALMKELRFGVQLHARAVIEGFVGDLYVQNNLLTLYGKCRMLTNLQKVFDTIRQPDMVSWNTLIHESACIAPSEAVTYFEMMIEKTNFKPNDITWTAVLTACMNGGMADKGLLFFTRMTKDFNMEHNDIHRKCALVLYSQMGDIDQALNIMKYISDPPHKLLGYVLNCCHKAGVAWERVEMIASQMLAVEHLLDRRQYIEIATEFERYGRSELAQDVRQRLRLRGRLRSN